MLPKKNIAKIFFFDFWKKVSLTKIAEKKIVAKIFFFDFWQKVSLTKIATIVKIFATIVNIFAI